MRAEPGQMISRSMQGADPPPPCVGVRFHQIGQGLLLVAVPKRLSSSLETLTDSELGVARLAAAGVSNRAAAALRGSATRTIANQLASVYRKLGISGRRELRAHLRER